MFPMKTIQFANKFLKMKEKKKVEQQKLDHDHDQTQDTKVLNHLRLTDT